MTTPLQPDRQCTNVFTWRAAHGEMVGKFLLYADHYYTCAQKQHKHDVPERRADERAVCDAAPCNCGLVDVLEQLTTITYTFPCPDKPQLLQLVRRDDGTPVTVFGLPVMEDVNLPEGTIRVRNVPKTDETGIDTD